MQFYVFEHFFKLVPLTIKLVLYHYNSTILKLLVIKNPYWVNNLSVSHCRKQLLIFIAVLTYDFVSTWPFQHFGKCFIDFFGLVISFGYWVNKQSHSTALIDN